MPLNLPDKLPAIELLKEENIFVIDNSRATQQDKCTLYIDSYLLMKLIGKYISFVPNNSGFVFVIGGFVMNSLFD